jgi:hypothetical protein
MAGARVVALDYSGAVDACYANLRQHLNLNIVQGDIYALPFLKASFPYVYSLGVLPHTPDIKRAFAALSPMSTEGGTSTLTYIGGGCGLCFTQNTSCDLLPREWRRANCSAFSSVWSQVCSQLVSGSAGYQGLAEC